MKQIDFYILEEQPRQALMLFVCRLLEKSWNQKRKAFVLCQDEEELSKLDELLWTFHDSAFIPHTNIKNPDYLCSPIILASEYQEIENIDILFNLSFSIISQHSLYPRNIEIIPDDEELKTKARERFTEYRRYGIELKTHRISK